jgi:hypothetical protein
MWAAKLNSVHGVRKIETRGKTASGGRGAVESVRRLKAQSEQRMDYGCPQQLHRPQSAYNPLDGPQKA